MPHFEDQFPPINPLVLQRPDALDPPDREEEETHRTENRAEDETPTPGSLADGIDRVTLSASARAIAPVQPTGETARLPADNPGSAGAGVVVSSLIDTRQVFEEDQETQALQPPAFSELDPDEPSVPILGPEARAENIPFVIQQGPLNVSLPTVEDAVAVAPAVPGSVEALDENPQALRPDNLGTDPALRSNRELRNILQDNRLEPPEAVIEPTGGPVTEIQNNAPPPPAVLENLEAVRAELLNDTREQEGPEGVTRPEEEPAAPPEPRTPETLLTELGQNIDRFI
jgi:hypothetical protein